jgi:hypothetical protein
MKRETGARFGQNLDARMTDPINGQAEGPTAMSRISRKSKSKQAAGGDRAPVTPLKPLAAARKVQKQDTLTEIAKQIDAAHKVVVKALRTSIGAAFEVGELLLKARKQVRHGGWENWIAKNTQFGARMARNYMRLAELDPAKRKQISDLGIRGAIDAIAEKLPVEVRVETRVVSRKIVTPFYVSKPDVVQKIAAPGLKTLKDPATGEPLVPTRTGMRVIDPDTGKITGEPHVPTAEPVVDRRAQHTVINGTPMTASHAPSHQRVSGSGSSTTSAAEIATRLLVELIAHGISADPVKVAQLLRKKLSKEQVEKLLNWFERLGKAIATAEEVAS